MKSETPQREGLKTNLYQAAKIMATFAIYFSNNHYFPTGINNNYIKLGSPIDLITTSKPFKLMSSGDYRKTNLEDYINQKDTPQTEKFGSKLNDLDKLNKENKLELSEKIKLEFLKFWYDSGREAFQVIDNSRRTKDKIGIVGIEVQTPIGKINPLAEIADENLPYYGTVGSTSIALLAELPYLRELTPYNRQAYPNGPNNLSEIDWNDVLSALIGGCVSGGVTYLMMNIAEWEVGKLEEFLKFLTTKNKK